MSNTNCPDCGQAYRHHEVVLAERIQAPTSVEEATEEEITVSIHEDVECPVARERDLLSGLRQVVYHYGAAKAVALLADVIEEFNREGKEDEGGRPRSLIRPLKEYHRGRRGEPRADAWQEVLDDEG